MVAEHVMGMRRKKNKRREIQLIVYDRGRKMADVTTMADASRRGLRVGKTPGDQCIWLQGRIYRTRVGCGVSEYEPIGKADGRRRWAADRLSIMGAGYPADRWFPHWVLVLAVCGGGPGSLRWPLKCILNRPKPQVV